MPVGISASDMELYLAIRTALVGSGIKDAQKEIKKIGQESVAATDRTATPAWRRMRGEMNNMLGPISTVRMAIFRLRFLWIATFGAMVGWVISIINEFGKLRKEAEALNITFQEYTKLRFGEVIDDKAVRQLTLGFAELGNSIDKARLKSVNWIAEAIVKPRTETQKNINQLIIWNATLQKFNAQGGLVGLVARRTQKAINLGRIEVTSGGGIANNQEVIELTKEQVSIYGKLRDEINKLSMSDSAYRIKQLGLAYQNYYAQLGLDLEMPQKKKEMLEQMLNDWKEHSLQVINYARFGFKTIVAEWQDLSKQFVQNTSKMFSDVFIDALDNRLQNARQIFYSFITDIRNAFIRAAINQMMASMVTSAISGGHGLPTQIGSYTGYKMAEGGIVNKPTMALIGEAGPEAVVPLSGGNNRLGGDTYIYINAVDAQSFSELVRRNPDAITTVVQQNVKSNKSLRHTIRER